MRDQRSARRPACASPRIIYGDGAEHGPALLIAAYRRIFDEPVGGAWAGDHFGVVANLALPPA
jgi:hypothetical protein